MSVLTVVRHGQASFLADDYDVLSPLGELQARRLGEYWSRHGIRYDRIYTGPRLRQQRTAEIAVEVCQAHGVAAPAPITLPELDEHHGHDVLTQYLPALAAEDHRLRELEVAFLGAQELPNKARAFQKLFEDVMLRWVREELLAPEFESWRAFVTRVRTGIKTMTAYATPGQRIAAFTSGGPSGVAMQHALAITDEAALNLTWMVRNTAMTEFLFTAERFTVSSFNAFPHLDNSEWWTYR